MGIGNIIRGRRSSTSAPTGPISSGDLPTELPRLDRFDPLLDNQALRNAYVALQSGDWNLLESLLTNSALASLFVEILSSEHFGIDPIPVDQWIWAKKSPYAKLLGHRLAIRDAFTLHRQLFESRTSQASTFDEAGTNHLYPNWAPGRPSNPYERPEDQPLADSLATVERDLRLLADDYPEFADVWIAILMTGRGRSVPLNQMRENFEQLHQRHPFHPEGCRRYLESLTKRWGGSSVATLDTARWIQMMSPPDSGARLALPLAHIEMGFYQEGVNNLHTYLMMPEVANELVDGLEAMLVATDDGPARVEHLAVFNAYMLAVVVQDKRSAFLMDAILSRIENRPTEWPWSVYGPDIAGTFQQAQAYLRKAIGRF